MKKENNRCVVSSSLLMQVKKLLQKILHHDVFKYRKFTDREVDKDGACELREQEKCCVSSDELDQLARGELSCCFLVFFVFLTFNFKTGWII